MGREDYIKWFSELNNKDISIAGGKGASLAEMYRNKFPVPPGFIVTAEAYRDFIESSGVKADVQRILAELNIEDTISLDKASKKIRGLIEGSKLPQGLQDEIFEAYSILSTSTDLKEADQSALDILKTSREGAFVAVRSSATTEDLADASFAGQQDSFLAVKGEKDLIDKIKKCFASLFTSRAIYYRTKKGFDHSKSYLAIVVQRMIDSDKSGVIFSKNPLADDGNVVIEAVWGLGEGIVSGRILPDHYIVDPRRDYEISEKKISDKKIAMVRKSSGEIGIVNLTEERSKQSVLSDYELKRLGQYSIQLEQHYKKPQDIEFAIENSQIYVVQSRPITTKVMKSDVELEGKVLFTGLPASPGISSGAVKIIDNLEDLSKIKRGDVLVTKMTNPDMVVAMQKAAAIITDEGGITSHASIVSREMGIPAVVGTRVATEKLKEGQIVSVDGFTGRILEGKAHEKKAEVKQIVKTKIKIKAIVDIPEYAKRAADSGARAVGLTRIEGIIASGGKHPVYYIKKDKMKEYIEMIYQGLKKISKPFDEIWVRTSDIRSDEYRNLEGAPEISEGNPMLGDHGIRFSLKNQDLLEAEFKAVKEVADEFPDKKFGIMLPQVISVEEVKRSKNIFNEIVMPANVKFGIMVETPAAVMIIEELCNAGIDFVSFGTNDLTQYTLAIDRNNSEVQELYDEMNSAVLNSIKRVIRACKKYKVETSICGQAGSRKEMAEFLVREGIDSISVNADAAYNVSVIVAETEGNVKENYEAEEEIPAVIENDTGGEENEEDAENSQENTSEEEIILRALGEGDEYSPGFANDEKKDLPVLNDAIPVESSHLEEKEKDEEIEFDNMNELAEEALAEEVMEEVQESEAREQYLKDQDRKPQREKGKNSDTLDIS